MSKIRNPIDEKVDMSVWKGRIDKEELGPALRWHQVVVPFDDLAWSGSRVTATRTTPPTVSSSHS